MLSTFIFLRYIYHHISAYPWICLRVRQDNTQMISLNYLKFLWSENHIRGTTSYCKEKKNLNVKGSHRQHCVKEELEVRAIRSNDSIAEVQIITVKQSLGNKLSKWLEFRVESMKKALAVMKHLKKTILGLSVTVIEMAKMGEYLERSTLNKQKIFCILITAAGTPKQTFSLDFLCNR